MRFIFALLLVTSLYASLHDKSAMVYYGKNISYSLVGVHDYIIVQPRRVNTSAHGFKTYKEKMYAYVSIGEIDRTIPEYTKIKKEWIVAQNKAWKSDVLDWNNAEYIEFLFAEMIEPQLKRGFKHFFFDTLDSYHLATKTAEEKRVVEKALAGFINEFHRRYPDSKLIVNRGFEIIDEIHDSVEAVLFESYFHGIGGANLGYKEVNNADREWLDIQLENVKKYKLNIICVDYLLDTKSKKAKDTVVRIKQKGMIPYVANRELDSYGISSKNAIKREILMIVDESKLDIMEQGAVLNSGMVLEYMGYMQRFHDINKGFLNTNEMSAYAGVIIWTQGYYKEPKKLIDWVLKVSKLGIKVVFVNNFAMDPNNKLMEPLGIQVTKSIKKKKEILVKDQMISYEIEPALSLSTLQVTSKNIKPLLMFEFDDSSISTVAAITSWGAYAVDDAFMVTIEEDNLWVIDPYKFFKEALELKNLIVPDVTTENGNRLLFTHIDGDGMMNRVEGDFGYYSGDVILNKILKVYKIPHSVSVIGSEIAPDGLYPKLSSELMSIAKDMYALDNVEPATHTYTHPFIWGKIKNGHLDKKYRLKPKGYEFSFKSEFVGSLKFINDELDPKHKAQCVFWSGDCIPRVNALSYVYENNILNINGGDTLITKTRPWISGISPLGLQRENYVQVFTGAQNENVFTNDWLGPFWGFKRVTQTFELTDSPRRLKPIDIYYHIYSGSKLASLTALEYVFDWALEQESMPIYTSEYIPKVMDYYVASLAYDEGEWMASGLNDLSTIRVEETNATVSFDTSKSVMGVKHYEGHTYLSLDKADDHYLSISKEEARESRSYMISSNAKVVEYSKSDKQVEYEFEGYVALRLNFFVADGCQLHSEPAATTVKAEGKRHFLNYEDSKRAKISIECE